MIKIENVEVVGLHHAIRGMRNPMNIGNKSDSGICKGGDDGIGCENCAMQDACTHAYDHSFQLGKTDYELMMKQAVAGSVYAKYRRMIVVYLCVTAPSYWWKQFSAYEVEGFANSLDQKQTVMLNYEALSKIYQDQWRQELDEWREFCQWIKSLPYSNIITCKRTENEITRV